MSCDFYEYIELFCFSFEKSHFSLKVKLEKLLILCKVICWFLKRFNAAEVITFVIATVLSWKSFFKTCVAKQNLGD